MSGEEHAGVAHPTSEVMNVDPQQDSHSKVRNRGARSALEKLSLNYEVTINFHKRLHGVTFKKRAPRAVKIIKAVARKTLNVKLVVLSTNLNSLIWSKGIRSVPRRIRVSMRLEPTSSRRRFFKSTTRIGKTNSAPPYYILVDSCGMQENARKATSVVSVATQLYD